MTNSAAGPPLTITLQIPIDWTPEQTFAVFQLIDDLREAIWQGCAPQIQDEYRDYCSPASADLGEQGDSDPAFCPSNRPSKIRRARQRALLAGQRHSAIYALIGSAANIMGRSHKPTPVIGAELVR
jgi:hypothetical protein